MNYWISYLKKWLALLRDVTKNIKTIGRGLYRVIACAIAGHLWSYDLLNYKKTCSRCHDEAGLTIDDLIHMQ